MNPEDIERRLSDAFTSQAYGAVDDNTPVPPLRLDRPATRPRRSFGRVLAPLATAAAIAAVAVGIAVHQNDNTAGHPKAQPGISGHGSSTPPNTRSTTLPAATVHVSLRLSDGSQVGVGMPIIAFLSRPVDDLKAFAAATKVTVNGKPAIGAWYCEEYTSKATPIECDWRMQNYWPAHAKIHVDLPVKGLSAGPGLVFDDSLTSDFATGPANILTVDDNAHLMTVVSDGKKIGVYPVSLGAPDTPTSRGVKVIMEKGASICMSGPGYHECGIKYTQRLTYSGEYLHAAPWNVAHIKTGIDSSNGCTNLLTNDAKKLYDFLEIGDVVNYPNANGKRMGMGDGYGDWNVPWGTWLTGGLVATH